MSFGKSLSLCIGEIRDIPRVLGAVFGCADVEKELEKPENDVIIKGKKKEKGDAGAWTAQGKREKQCCGSFGVCAKIKRDIKAGLTLWFKKGGKEWIKK